MTMAVAFPLSFPRLLCLSILSSSLLAPFSAASPWIVTANYEELVTVISGYTDYYDEYTEPAETYTEIISVASPSGAAISTATITQTDEYSEDLMTIVEILYPYESATPTATDSSYATSTGYDNIYTNFYVNFAYTAPTACSSTWSYTTAVEVDPPYEIDDALVPTSVSTSYYTDNSSPFQPTVITEVYAFLNPTQVPASSLSYLSSAYAPYPSCYNPDSGYSSSGSSGNSGGSSSSSGSSSGSVTCNYYFCSSDEEPSWINDSSVYGISPLAIILITVLGWTFLIFVVGLFENYFHFQRLMKGWQSRRGFPITWLLWAFPLSCLICFAFSRRGFQARSEEDAKELQQKWKERGFWNKKKVWLRYGFGWGYPSILGPAPPRVGRPSAKQVKTPLLQVTPPASETGPVSRQPTPRTSNGDGDVENTAATAPMAERQMSGGLSPPTTQTQARSAPAAEDEITEVPEVPVTTHNPYVSEATEKPVSEKGEE